MKKISKRMLALVIVLSLTAIIFTGCTSDSGAELKDGTYNVEGSADEHGWLPKVSVIIENGKITAVDYKEVAVEASEGIEKGDVKSPDNYDFEPPFEVIEEVGKLIIKNNGTENLDVDGITGATSTRTTMLELTEEALKKAK